ncbi:putative MCAK-like kinesin [Trypanosoma cruzi]|uniref:MCAK-like kinesin n=1 Tax=Trypanosoma cruzi Dm28c TaxID=1416333 RepID=V5BQ58_TRYCR|nr:MCAK-like kinesin [Trypanosoma cruzi Dm28c]PBJ75337.1 hypothetical protein BCY84_11162 [Trypanosoma cruzi cruzi]RNF25025.1 putative MCAK-like kinesin [Trypanosoma cruzi]
MPGDSNCTPREKEEEKTRVEAMGDEMSGAKYELQKNVLLKAIRPGGLFYEYVDRGPVEMLCVPHQLFLESSGIAPYLHLPSPHSHNSSIATTTLRIGERDVALTPEQHQQIACITREAFLDYHLVHFDGVASPAFVTLRGQRGEFSADLQSVARYGRIGASKVLCELSPLLEPDDPSVSAFHPCKLHILVLAKPLMDDEEVHNLLSALQRILPPMEGAGTEQCQNDQKTGVEQTPGPSFLENCFSREAILNYRRTVAKDNDVHSREFQEMMKLPVCAPVAKTISNFVETIQQREAPLFDDTDVRRAISFCLDQCRRIPLFARDASKLHIAAEGFEKYIMTKLYWRAFGVDPEERERNKELNEKLRRLSPLVNAEELDALKEVEEHHLWGQAMLDLEGMNFFKTPREKLRCAVRACEGLAKAVSAALVQKKKKCFDGNIINNNDNIVNNDNSKSMDENPVVFGADEFLPCFMLLVLRASPRDYYLHVHYVKRFRDASLITPHESYCLTNLESAAEFWRSYTASFSRQTDTSRPSTPQKTIVEDLFIAPVATSSPVQPADKDEICAVAQQRERKYGQLSNSSLQHDFFSLTGDVAPEGINVAKLLLEERKPFENLTVAELRGIVDEARRLLTEKHKSTQSGSKSPD